MSDLKETVLCACGCGGIRLKYDVNGQARRFIGGEAGTFDACHATTRLWASRNGVIRTEKSAQNMVGFKSYR